MSLDSPIPRSPRVLSIQSHVVSGYCGNKSATFPLQLLEFEVDVVNSVQLSNHTQYKITRGQIFEAKDLEQIHEGLKENNLLKHYDLLLSGYVADVGYIEAMAKLIAHIKEERRRNGLSCLYTLDPVLGDDGTGYYVPNGYNVCGAYKQYLMPLTDIITPNRFEASILSGVQIDPKSDSALQQCMQAIQVIHETTNIQVVVITSIEIEAERGTLICLLSHDPGVGCRKMGDQSKRTWSIRVPKFDCPFTGTGDLFTALFTAWLHKTQFDFKESLENTANSVHEILEDTLKWFHQENDNSVYSHELRLVQNRAKILSPEKKFKAQPIDTSQVFHMSQQA